MLKDNYDKKNEQDQIPPQYKNKISYNKEMCIDCNNYLVREQFRITLRMEMNFKNISDDEKAGMIASGLLPDDICFFCGDRIPPEIDHKPMKVYGCGRCAAARPARAERSAGTC